MRRQYFAHYYKRFGNTYNLLYADTQEELKMIPEDAERITRKEAEALCAQENYRRKYDRSMSGYADSMIYPVSMTEMEQMYLHEDGSGRSKYYKNGYIWEKKNRT